MGCGLLGVHVNTTVNGLVETVRAWRPPLVVVLDHSDVWHSVKVDSPHTRFVGRIYQEFEPNFNDPALDPLPAARDHCEMILPWAERMGATYSYWQGVNEPVIHSPEAMQRYADFESERARIMAGHGFRVVVGSFSVGNPAKLAHWQGFLPALEATRQFEGALALHEYAWPTLDRDWPWYLLRHRKVYDGDPRRDWEGLPRHLKTIPLLITECGLDGLLEQGSPPRGWQALYGNDPDRYLEQLAWYDAALQKDAYVWGAAIYCCGVADFTWKSYDIWPDLAQRLARVARPVYRHTVPEPPEPDRPLRRLGPTGPRRAPQIVSLPADAQTIVSLSQPVPPLDGVVLPVAGGSPQSVPALAGPAGTPETPQESTVAASGGLTPITAGTDARDEGKTAVPQPPPPSEYAMLKEVAARLDRIIQLLQG